MYLYELGCSYEPGKSRGDAYGCKFSNDDTICHCRVKATTKAVGGALQLTPTPPAGDPLTFGNPDGCFASGSNDVQDLSKAAKATCKDGVEYDFSKYAESVVNF